MTGSGIHVSPDMDPKEALAHFGKKGMKWGVRNDAGHEGEQVKAKQLGKLDKKWEKENTGMNGYIKVHNAVADKMNNGEIDRFNNEPRWAKAAADGHLSNDNHPETKAYFDAYEGLCNKMMNEGFVELGVNPSGSKGYAMTADADGNQYAYLAAGYMQHADTPLQDLVYEIKRDAKGLVSELVITTRELMHFGRMGMRWGVTSTDASGGGNKSRGELRALNKQTKATNKAAGAAAQREANLKIQPQRQKPDTGIDREILKARSELSKHTQEYKDAKSQYKIDKQQIGKTAAKVSLHEAGDQLRLTRNAADHLTTKEQSAYRSRLIGEQIAAVLTKSATPDTTPGSLAEVMRRSGAKNDVARRS